ncbi:hypothetical protein CIB84_015470 [Bambusicola thoracicus]
MAQNQ